MTKFSTLIGLVTATSLSVSPVLAASITLPILIAFAYKLGAPEIREHTSWWWQYVFVSVIAYSELKNIIVRVAQIRHILRQDEWVVTPRGHVDRTSTRT